MNEPQKPARQKAPPEPAVTSRFAAAGEPLRSVLAELVRQAELPPSPGE